MTNWTDAASRPELARRRVMEVEAEGVALLLHDIAGAAYATAAVCPHHSAWLSQGGVEGELVNCPRHQGQFHVPTGRKTRGPECPDLRTYPVQVRDGRVWVDLG